MKKKIHRIDRKGLGKPADIVWSNGQDRGPAKKKSARPVKAERDQPAARAQTESPRGSTIPPYPKERIDD